LLKVSRGDQFLNKKRKHRNRWMDEKHRGQKQDTEDNCILTRQHERQFLE